MTFTDKTLVCKDCGNEFVWTAREQEFFAEKGFTNEPTRCKEDRLKHRQQREAQRTEIVCKNCGKTATVNFKPRNPDDILCDDCFAKQKEAIRASHTPAEAPAAPAVDAKDDEVAAPETDVAPAESVETKPDEAASDEPTSDDKAKDTVAAE